jgi:hypothetical protein
MKSLNNNPFKSSNPEIFTDEILDFIKKEGFEFVSNDSYCYKKADFENWCEKAFYKNIPNSKWTINCYIFENAIGLDIDYYSGGNCSWNIWKFSDYSFEECYDKLVDTVNSYR